MRIAAGPIIALVVTAAVYIRGLGNQFVYDDNEMIVLNRYIGDWAMIWRSFVNDSWWFRNPLKLPQSAYYRPLQDVWLALNFHVFGLSPLGWHVTILAVHLICVWLVFGIARELVSGRWTPMFAALLFGVIPVHAQAVVWPSAIPLPMSAAFEMAAFLALLHAHGAHKRLSAWALIFFAGSLFSHESAVAFPIIVMGWAVLLGSSDDAYPAARGLGARIVSSAVVAAPFAIEAIIYLAIRFSVLGIISRQNHENAMTLYSAILTIPGALGYYVTILAIPWRAAPVHSLEIASGLRSPQFYMPALGLIAIALAARLGLGAHRHRLLYLFCALWAVAALLPVLNLRSLNPQVMVEDRYVYFASAGWCMFVADVVLGAESAAVPGAAAAAVAAIAAVYMVVLVRAEAIWRDELTLFSVCVERSPYSALYHSRLGMALSARGRLEDAEREQNRVLELKPGDPVTLYNLGVLHERMGRMSEAAFELKRGLEGLPDAPAQAWVELAVAADSAGDSTSSEQALQHAAGLPEGQEAAAIGRVQIKMAHNDPAAAESILREMTAAKPDSFQGWVLLGGLMAREGRAGESLDAFKRALALRPDDPSVRLTVASTLHRMGREKEAFAECETILRQHPGYDGARRLEASIRTASAR